ncbi:MAG: 50S ribosomal protein L32 [Candidatus Yonathbacteria bacterium]|nr:50S ribosomal protein L32 [Candidatus Yonathbacteria bacterium]
MTVRMRHTRAHTGNRRSHHAISAPHISTCVHCGAPHMRHRMCPTCGTYRGHEVVDVVAKKERTIARAKTKAKSRGLDVKEAETKVKDEAKASKSTAKTAKTKKTKK